MKNAFLGRKQQLACYVEILRNNLSLFDFIHHTFRYVALRCVVTFTMDFIYVSKNVPGTGSNLIDFETKLDGCRCEIQCTAEGGCSCSKYDKAYDDDGLLLLSPESNSPVTECNDLCRCSYAAEPVHCYFSLLCAFVLTYGYSFSAKTVSYKMALRFD